MLHKVYNMLTFITSIQRPCVAVNEDIWLARIELNGKHFPIWDFSSPNIDRLAVAPPTSGFNPVGGRSRSEAE